MLAAVMVVGAQRWVDIGPVQVQPSEFAKLGMVIVLAGYFAEKPVGEHAVFLKALGILAVPALLVFMQPDLGTALVFGAVFVVMSYIAGARLIQLVALGVAGAVGAVAAVKLGVLEEYQIARLTAFSDPDCTKYISYQVCQSKMAIGSGGSPGRASTPRRSPTWATCRRSKQISSSPTSQRGWGSWGA
jgi:rod shape determining protein RodA